MLKMVFEFALLVILFCQFSSQDGVNETNSTDYFPQKTSKVSQVTLPRTVVKTTSPKPKPYSKPPYPFIVTQNSSRYNWTQIIHELYDKNSTIELLVSKKGLRSLMQSLGFSKNYGRSKNIKGSTIKCLSPDDILGDNSIQSGLTTEQFQDVCPTLLLQVHNRVCRASVDRIIIKKDNMRVWLYSSGSVLLCSLMGLVVVWLIPLLPKSHYNGISQLLIALAVGSLTGDALLHLIPHALLDNGSGGHSHGKDTDQSHSKMVWKALAAFIGIHLFFLTERITILCQNFKSKRKSKNKQLSHHAFGEVQSNDTSEDRDKRRVKYSDMQSSPNGKLHWANKSRKYSGSSRELVHASSSQNVLTTETNIGTHFCNPPRNRPRVNSDCPDSMNLDVCDSIDSYSTAVEEDIDHRWTSNVGIKYPANSDVRSSNDELNMDLKAYENRNGRFLASKHRTEKENNWSEREEDHLVPHSHTAERKRTLSKQSESGVELGVTHPFQNRPHGHHHGHSHDLSSVKAIAYTVIVGDGLHNFCDGIAIGAAFANNLRGGLSTSIAVFCHELPHELGDFVVLLHAGMSFRTAIFYNLVSSIFCGAGMVIGVLLGAVPSVSSWIFMITAGIFLYIALVDMMPELSTRRLQGSKFFHKPSVLFLWQNIGLLLGAVIMLLIALYEEDMQ